MTPVISVTFVSLNPEDRLGIEASSDGASVILFLSGAPSNAEPHSVGTCRVLIIGVMMHERLEDIDPHFAELRVQLEDAKERVKKLENDIQSYYIANKIKRQFKRLRIDH